MAIPVQLHVGVTTTLSQITAPDDPGERLMACVNPRRADRTRRTRRTAAARRTKKPLDDAPLGMNVGCIS
jgi:hypothetical protein